MDDRESDLLASFECQCRGIKFYDSADATLRCDTSSPGSAERSNPHNYFCVAAFVCEPELVMRSRWSLRMLGHVAREACRLLCPLLSAPTLRVTRSVQIKSLATKKIIATHKMHDDNMDKNIRLQHACHRVACY